MSMPMHLDHIVINVQRNMDQAEAAFADLGFHLTPRGYHTLGSINALAMFATDYLELLGFPADGEIQRPELAAAPLGLNGLVFKATNVDETFAHLTSLGVAGDPPKAFSRPVTLADGETRDAKFRTVAVRAEAFPAGRFYFCEHQTPELVWRPEWQSHANAATRFIDMTVVAQDAAGTADLIAHIIGSDTEPGTTSVAVASGDSFRLLCQTPAQYAAEYGEAARNLGDRAAMLGAVTIKGTLSGGLEQRLSGDERFVVAKAGDRTRLLIPAFDAVVNFTST